MEIDSCYLFDEEYTNFISSTIMGDSIDEYLEDPALNVFDMIEKYDVPIINTSENTDKKPLRCVVCGAKAFGYNFDQITCESCKAFFRRNALKDMNDLHCRFSGNCNITVENRRHCSYCRIKKCFALGMRKEWIRSEEEKATKRAQLERSRRRKPIQQTVEVPIPTLMLPGRLNHLMMLTSTDRIRLNNISHCYDIFTSEPTIAKYPPPSEPLILRVHEYINRKKNVVIHFISYFKHLPELQTLDMDDQVSLIKQNIRLVLPFNYALLRAAPHSKFGTRRIQTIDCVDNIDIHALYRSLGQNFVQFVAYDPIVIKLIIIVMFFTTNSLTTTSVFDPAVYKDLNHIKEIQTSYTELLWLYITEKWGEEYAVHLFTRLITKFLHIQVTLERLDTIIRMNDGIENIDSLMQTVLQLT